METDTAIELTKATKLLNYLQYRNKVVTNTFDQIDNAFTQATNTQLALTRATRFVSNTAKVYRYLTAPEEVIQQFKAKFKPEPFAQKIDTSKPVKRVLSTSDTTRHPPKQTNKQANDEANKPATEPPNKETHHSIPTNNNPTKGIHKTPLKDHQKAPQKPPAKKRTPLSKRIRESNRQIQAQRIQIQQARDQAKQMDTQSHKIKRSRTNPQLRTSNYTPKHSTLTPITHGPSTTTNIRTSTTKTSTTKTSKNNPSLPPKPLPPNSLKRPTNIQPASKPPRKKITKPSVRELMQLGSQPLQITEPKPKRPQSKINPQPSPVKKAPPRFDPANFITQTRFNRGHKQTLQFS